MWMFREPNDSTIFKNKLKKQKFQAELKERLTPTQYLVTQEHQTEKYQQNYKIISRTIQKTCQDHRVMKRMHLVFCRFYSP